MHFLAIWSFSLLAHGLEEAKHRPHLLNADEANAAYPVYQAERLKASDAQNASTRSHDATKAKVKEAEVNSKGHLTQREPVAREGGRDGRGLSFFQEELQMRVIRETGEPVRREVAKLSDRDVVLDEMEAEGADSEDDFTLPREEQPGKRSDALMRRQGVEKRQMDLAIVAKWFGVGNGKVQPRHWWRKTILVFVLLAVAVFFMCVAVVKADYVIKRVLPQGSVGIETGSELQEPEPKAKAKPKVKDSMGLASLVEGALGGALGQCAVRKPGKGKESDSIRSRIEALPVSAAAQVEKLLPSAGGYDVSFSRPMSSRWLLRLEAVIQDGVALLSPLTRQPCVLYTAHAMRKVHGGMPLPLAFASQHIDFTVTLRSAPDVAIRVAGSEVNLFSKDCELAEVLPFPCAPDHWQDFVSGHLSGGVGAESHAVENELRVKGAAVEFHECCLMTGATVTLVGELLRSASGELTLQPLSQEQVSWRTSWEKAGAEDLELLEARTHVLISDDPSLLSLPGDEPQG